MKISVKQNQTIQDISTMYTGSGENAIAILLANGKNDTTLYVGEELTIPETLVSKKMIAFYTSNGDVVGCSPVPLDPAQWTPPAPSPNSDVNVRINGSFYKTVNAPTTVDIPFKNSEGEALEYTVEGDDVMVDDVQVSFYANGTLQQTVSIPVGANEIININ